MASYVAAFSLSRAVRRGDAHRDAPRRTGYGVKEPLCLNGIQIRSRIPVNQ